MNGGQSKQVTVRLNPEEKALFDLYAQSVGLDGSELFKLLIIREEKLQRLRALKAKDQIPAFPRQSRGTGLMKPTVTAHFSNPETASRFSKYATSCGLIKQTAGAWLLSQELNERWLERALSRLE